ncbi:MAG: APC family permease [Planctomycetota bacterium]
MTENVPSSDPPPVSAAAAAAQDDASAKEQASLLQRLEYLLVGRPRDVRDARVFHRLSLIPFLAWVGMGADGLSSSAYGPEAAYRALGHHTYLAIVLALLTGFTVLVISACYSKTIEQFPSGGGAYVVASKLLGPSAGAIAGTALLVDYVLTITTSVAAAGDAMFSLLHVDLHGAKLSFEVATIVALIVLNLRGVRESILVLLPLFLVFLLTHAVLILGGMLASLPHMAHLPGEILAEFDRGRSELGGRGLFLLVLYAYSLGGGTYTGIEAVSNGLPIIREPRVRNARRTMVYMAVSLAVTAAGLLLCYLLFRVTDTPGKTMNVVLVERFVAAVPVLGKWFVALTVLSEAALLFVASQTGFIDGPRVMANLAQDSWIPRKFAALSDRLTTQNGVLLIGLASLGALLYAGGNVETLVVMYSINVFVTFLLSMLGMCRFWLRQRGVAGAKRNLLLYASGTLLCGTILVITVCEKFAAGGWITLSVTGALLALCILIRKHYARVEVKLQDLDRLLGSVELPTDPNPGIADPTQPTAVVLVSRYSGLGTHTVLNVLRLIPGYFKNMLFVSVGVVDTGNFKGPGEVENLEKQTVDHLERYTKLARAIGVQSAYRFSLGTDTVDEVERLCTELAKEFPRILFFSGQLIFERERWYHRFLHNQTAFAIQKRLQWGGLTMAILPVRVFE